MSTVLMRLKERLRPFVLAGRRIRGGELSLIDAAWGRATSFSQFGEDMFLEQYFAGKPPGFYVDVGALHPFLISNTHVLHRRGWRGINLEPNPDALRLFRRYRPCDINLPWAIASSAKVVNFAIDGSFSGIDDDHYLWKDGGRPTIEVQTKRLSEVLNIYMPPDSAVDFLCVDCEGHDLDVLHSNDWKRWRPSLIAIEAHEGRDPKGFLESQGYVRLAQLGLTQFYERKF